VDRRVERSELEKLLMSAIDETKKKFVYKRLTSELNSGSARKSNRSREEVETALLQLSELAKDKVKIEEFTHMDKQNLLEIFVT